MNENQQYKSDALAAIHKTMKALYEIGAIDSITMREFDQDCLEPIKISDLGLDYREPEYVTPTYAHAVPTYRSGVDMR